MTTLFESVLFRITKNKTAQKIVFFLLVLIVLGIHIQKLFSSFNNVYVLDLMNCISELSQTSPRNKTIIYHKRQKRIRDITGSDQFIELSDSYNDLTEVFVNYITSKSSIYLISTQTNNSLAKTDNLFQIETNRNVFSEQIHLITNSKHNKFVSVYHLLPFSFDLDFRNNQLLASPGHFTIGLDDVSSTSILRSLGDCIEITGRNSHIFSRKSILVSDNIFHSSVKVKNIGSIPAHVIVGYATYSQDCIKLDSRNYPYNGINKILKVISSEKGSNRIIVDSFSKWTKKSHLALDAKEDISDIPSNTLLPQKIQDVVSLSNGHAEIVFDEPLNEPLKVGSNVRIHGLTGSEIYLNRKVLQPGEEELFVSEIRKDDNLIRYSSEAFPKGVYYVTPVLFSYSVDSSENNTVLVSDFNLSF